MLLDRTDFTELLTIKKGTREDLTVPLLGIDLAYQQAVGKHQISVGATFMEDSANGLRIEDRVTGDLKPNLADDNAKKQSTGIYIQDIWSISDDVLITYGVRYDSLSAFENQWSYRLAFSYDINESWYTKAQIGTAYHLPSYREFLDVTAFNLALAPEKLTTYELHAGYRTQDVDLNIILYQNDYRDFIKDLYVEKVVEQDVERIVDDEVAFNADSRKINGLELNAKIGFSSNLNMSIGVSHLFNATETTGVIDSRNYVVGSDYISNKTNLNYLSHSYYHVGVIYKGKVGTSALNLTYYSSRSVSQSYQENIPIEQKTLDNVQGYLRADFNHKWLIKNWEINFKIKNLFDKDIFSQQFGGDSGYDHPWPGRQIFLSTKFSW